MWKPGVSIQTDRFFVDSILFLELLFFNWCVPVRMARTFVFGLDLDSRRDRLRTRRELRAAGIQDRGN